MTFAALTQRRKQVHNSIISSALADSVTRCNRACTQILFHSQVSKEPSTFQHLGDAALDDLRGVKAVDPLAVKEDGAAHDARFVNIQQSRNGAHDGRFASAIRAEQCDYCLIWHFQRDTLHSGDNVLIGHCDILKNEQGISSLMLIYLCV